jgi:hypothetical protein
MPDFLMFCLVVFALLSSMFFGIDHFTKREFYMSFVYGVVAPILIVFGATML